MSNLELGVIGNCQIAALIDGRGRYVWGSFPRMDSDPFFCTLLGGDRTTSGFFEAELLDCDSATQSYVHNTAILKTTLRDSSGNALEIVESRRGCSSTGEAFTPSW